jgi:hypothetical protein
MTTTNIDVHLVAHMAGDGTNVTVWEDTGSATDLKRQIAAPFPPGLGPFLRLVGPTQFEHTGSVTLEKVRRYLKNKVKDEVPGFWDVKNTPDIVNHVWRGNRWTNKSASPDFGWAFRIQEYRVASNDYADYTETRAVDDAGTDRLLTVYYYMVVQRRP